MLELKHVAYSYKATKKRSSQTWTISSKMGPFTALSVSLEQGKSTLLSLLAGLDNPKKGRFSLMGRIFRPKGLATIAKHHVSLVFQNYNLIDYLTPLENVRLVNKQAGKDILLELGLDETQIKTQCPSTIRRAATAGGYCACARFRSTCHLGRWADRKPWWTDSRWYHCHFEEIGQGT